MRYAVILIALAAASGAPAWAHDDVFPYALDGKIVTGGHDDVFGTNTIVERVFGYDFGEDPSDPYIIGDPGFNNGAFGIGVFPGDGLLPANFTLGFNVITNLEYWDGSGAVSFAAAPLGISLGLQRGSSTAIIDGSGVSGTVPTIGSTGAAGRLHVHLATLLNGSDGTNPLPPNAPEGIYMVGLELKLPGSGLANSDPIYFVFNNNLSEETHDLAISWVADSLAVPEPSTLVLAAMAAGALGLARVRRARVGKRCLRSERLEG